MKNPRKNEAVSQILGEIILLAIAVISVSIIYNQVLTTPGPQDITNVTITGKIEDGHPVFDLQRGESLEKDSKIYITIAGGYNRTSYSLDQLFSQEFLTNQKWNIGERIILPTENITRYRGPQVEGTIVDTKTNTIVFWGILQEGIVTRHKGGIWHFNEPAWFGIRDEVIDSSGNKNHGIAQGGANTVVDGVSLKSGYFDGYNDSVKVDTSWALNITDSITVEAWMKPLLSHFIFDTTTIDIDFGYEPYIVHVVGDYFAVVSEDKQKLGMIQTVKISPDGKTIEKVDNTTFGAATADQLLRPALVQMTEKLYLVAFNNDTNATSNSSLLRMELRTYTISQNGFIEYTSNDLSYTDYLCSNNPNYPDRPSLQKITDSLCAIAYWTPSYGGILRTVNISSTGQIIDTQKIIRYDAPMSNLGAVQCRDPCLVHVAGNIYAVAYYNASKEKGELKTFKITPTGDIIGPLDKDQFDTKSGYEPCLIQVKGQVFAVAYRNDLDHGSIKTYNITALGIIEPTGKNTTFTSAKKEYCFDPCIVHDLDEYFVIAYSTGSSGDTQGYVITLKLWGNGSIEVLYDSLEVFEKTKCFNPILLSMSKHLFAICYTGPVSHPGYLTTIFYGIENRGIYKGNAFMLSSAATMVKGSSKETMLYFEGSINGVMLYFNTTSSLPLVWHHIAITYNGTMIRLYVDGICQCQKNHTNHGIILTNDNLYFGRYYYGYIDEIAIYDVALTQNQLKDHITQPGTFKWYVFN
jgi:hypothetical protein